MEQLMPNGQRAKAAIMLIWIVLGVEMISLFSDYLQYKLLQDAVSGGYLSADRAQLNDFRQMMVGILYLVVYLFSVITFIKWFRRAYANLHLRVKILNKTEGWAAGSWFVPIVNLYQPVQIMSELYNETDELLVKKKIIPERKLATNYIALWWILWILSSLIGNLVFQLSKNAETIDGLINSTITSMISGLVMIPLSIITVKVIKDYAALEPLLATITEEENLPQSNIPTV